MIETIQSTRLRLTNGNTSSRALTEEALARATAPEGEGKFVFTHIDPARVRQVAEAIDSVRAAGVDLSPIAGIPISIKDLFDVQGEVTTAGSPQMRNRPPAAVDAPSIARLKRAGAVIVGRTNMTEFAFSGLGLNPHFGTPANPYERKRRRIPGGSSSGAAISVTDGMALAAIGSDTGGSVRIPAALSGLTGFKPTQRRISLEEVFPLSPSLDSVGVIAPTVTCCGIVDAVLAGDAPWNPSPMDLSNLSIAVPKNYFLDNLDEHVARTFERALSKLSGAGAKITDVAMPELVGIPTMNAKGGLAAAESYAFHRKLGTKFEDYDFVVRERILRGEKISAVDYLDIVEIRASMIRSFEEAHGGWDAILCPTVPLVAPEIRALQENAEELRRVNLLMIRNPFAVNLLDRCALSIPCHREGEAPVGLMVVGRHLGDKALLSAGLAVEKVFSVPGQ